jgi:hypothetical protein
MVLVIPATRQDMWHACTGWFCRTVPTALYMTAWAMRLRGEERCSPVGMDMTLVPYRALAQPKRTIVLF